MDIKIDNNTVVVFDLDDTLYNELDFLKSAYQGISQQLDPENWQSLYIAMFSLYRCKEDVFEMVSAKYKIPKLELVTLYREHEPKIKPFPGVLDVMHKIKEHQGKIGIITDGRKTTQIRKIRALGLFEMVDHIIISEEIGTEKPHLQNYRLMENICKPGTYWYIADNLKKDFITPNRLGWTTIGLMDNGFNIHCDSHRYMDAEHRPTEFISDYSDIKIV